MRRSRAFRILATTCLALFAGGRARAIINPNFTPVHLVSDAKLILQLKPGKPGAKGEATFSVVGCLKGKAPAKAPAIDLAAVEKAQAEGIRNLLAAVGDGPALLFVGEFPEGDDGEIKRIGYLHVGGAWFRLADAGGGDWKLEYRSGWMEATWAGGTDMLLRAVHYVLTDHHPDVPVDSGTGWKDPVGFGKIEGKVHGLQAVDLGGDGRLVLFAAAEAGDRVWRFDPKKETLAEITAELKLTSKSGCAAWGDFNADERLDLASWDGKAMTLWAQGEDGAFAAGTLKLEKPLPEGVIGLAALDAGGTVGLLVSTAGDPLLLKRRDAAWTARALVPLKGKEMPDPGKVAACLVADFDGDAIPDVLRPGANCSFLYRGKGAGAFAPPAVSSVAIGEGRGGACLGDYDMDGRLDVFTASEGGCQIWHNFGGGRFGGTRHLSGEIRYIAKPMCFAGQACDINNDGRQDVFILYQNRGPHFFFSRGFRSFGHAHGLDLQDQQILPLASEGQQAGVVADIDGDGSQDMVLVLKNGEMHFLLNDMEPDEALGVRAVLAGTSPAGPVTVTAWSEKRCLGGWSVSPGAPGAFFGCYEPGEIVLAWRLPGAKEARKKKFVVEDKLLRFAIKPE